jgi:hypothetical protein
VDDLVVLTITLVFFALALGYTAYCDRLTAGSKAEQ